MDKNDYRDPLQEKKTNIKPATHKTLLYLAIQYPLEVRRLMAISLHFMNRKALE